MHLGHGGVRSEGQHSSELDRIFVDARILGQSLATKDAVNKLDSLMEILKNMEERLAHAGVQKLNSHSLSLNVNDLKNTKDISELLKVYGEFLQDNKWPEYIHSFIEIWGKSRQGI